MKLKIFLLTAVVALAAAQFARAADVPVRTAVYTENGATASLLAPAQPASATITPVRWWGGYYRPYYAYRPYAPYYAYRPYYAPGPAYYGYRYPVSRPYTYGYNGFYGTGYRGFYGAPAYYGGYYW
ncbi:MAG TPA: hypothetical protein VL175_16220 [Pirellulales bacterium]|jgi:hypothetical protein|nr:hypothetical protein [Pirellulales bacterium]